ncbi:MAG: alpha/beta hydrolase [Fusobacterium sp. JB020]|nr:alpha/beta hydrolase [Fusobacterium sp. JB020]
MDNIKGIIQIIHGMSECKERYKDFINFYKQKGYIVFIEEHKYHGKKFANNLGAFNYDFNILIKDQIDFSYKLKKKYPDIPIYILGHSMGSFIAQEHMKTCSSIIKGYILAGSSYKPFFLWKFAKYFSLILDKFYKNKKADLIHKIIFLGYDSKFKKDNLKNSWLTRNIDSIKNYNKSNLTGFPYSSSFYKEFFFFLDQLYIKESCENISKNKPILIISGSLDPVGYFEKNVVSLYNYYLKQNFKNLTLKFFPNCRHELHNEINNIEIFNWILNWIKKADH